MIQEVLSMLVSQDDATSVEVTSTASLSREGGRSILRVVTTCEDASKQHSIVLEGDAATMDSEVLRLRNADAEEVGRSVLAGRVASQLFQPGG